MLRTGEIIKLLLDKNNLTIDELAEKTNLKKEAIRNVIYNKTKNPVYFNRIAEALGVTLETLTGTQKNVDIILSIYEISTKIVFEELRFLKIQDIALNTLITYINKAYDLLIEGKDEQFISIYFKGMMEGQLKYNIIEQIKRDN